MQLRTILSAVLLSSLALVAGAQERPRQPAWVGSIERGLELAQERGTVLMVALNMDNERGNQGMVDDVYTDPLVLDASSNCVVAIASMFQHKLVSGDTTGSKVCERFGSVTCDEHRTIEDTVRRDWLKRTPEDDVESPRHFFLAPDGTILFQKVWTMSAKDLAALMTRASEICTPERLERWDTLEGRLERALDPIAAVRDIALADLIDEADPEIDERLVKAAKDADDPKVAGSILGAFARADDEARRKLTHDALKHKEPAIRMSVAYAMGESGFADHLAPLLSRVGREKDDEAKGSMARAIGKLGSSDPDDLDKKVKKALLKMIGKTDDGGRDHAMVAIAPWAKEKDVKAALLKVFAQGGSQETRGAAAWALGHSADNDVREKLAQIREDTSRRDWRLKRMLENATKKLAGVDVRGWDGMADRLVPDPAVDDGEREEEPRWPGRGGR